MEEIVDYVALVHQSLESQNLFEWQIEIELLLQCFRSEVSGTPQLIDLQSRISLTHFLNENQDSPKGDVSAIVGKMKQLLQKVGKLLIVFVDI